MTQKELIAISEENYPYPDDYADVKRKAFLEGVEWAKEHLLTRNPIMFDIHDNININIIKNESKELY